MIFNCNLQLLIVILTIWSNVSSETPTTSQSVPDRSMIELIGDKYDRMAKSLSMADLEKDVSSNVLTFFVPTDEAFRDIPWSIAQEMLVNSTFLRLVIESHIIPGTFLSNILPGNSIYSVGGEPLNFTKKTVKDCDLVLVNSIPILEPDQITTNGVVHGITRLILPQKLIDECKCGQLKANDVEPKLQTSTTTNPINPSNLPERIVAGHSDQPNFVTVVPENYNLPSSDKFLRRSQAANPEIFNSPAANTSSTTPFPYYNVWDDLVANHNLTTNGNQGDTNKTREIEEERPRFFRTRIPGRVTTESSANPSSSLSPSSSPVEAVSGTNVNGGTQGSPTYYDNNSNPGSPTPPPRFGLRRRVVIRPQPTPRPYESNNSADVIPNDTNRPTPRPIENNNNNGNNDQFVPSVYYVEEPESVTTPRDNSPTYSPPLVYRPATSTTPSPFFRVTSPPLDNRRRAQGGRLLTDSPVNDQSGSPNNGNNGNNNDYATTRRPYFRRPVPNRSPDQGINRNASNCHPQDVNCLIANSPANYIISPSNGSPSNSPPRYDPRFKPELGPIREPDPFTVSTSPRTPVDRNDNRFRRPTTEYFLNDQTTPSTTFFDSTRRPTSRNPQDFWRPTPSTANPNYEDDSANYVRRFGSQRPGTERGSNQRDRTILRSTTTTTVSPNYRNVPVRPVDSRGFQNEPRYRPRSNEPVFPREPLSDNPTSDTNTIAAILEDPGLFLDKRPIAFSMFKDLLRRAGLHNLASAKKPITVFLPTDDAFEELENNGFEKIYRNPADLQTFLLRHLVNYPLKPSEMRDGLVVRSISNSPIAIKALDDGMVYANGSPILAATEATNGYVYVLGKVIRDRENKDKKDIVSEIEQLENASIFASLLRRSNLIPQLQEPGPWTVLVPDNEAFVEVPSETRSRILSDPAIIQSLVGNHIINGSFNSEKLSRARNILPLVGQKPLKIRAFPGAVIVNNHASVKQPDLEAQNGVVHTISRVLLPDELKTNQSSRGRGRAYEGLTDLSNQFHPRRGLYSDPNEKSNEDNQELGPKMKARKFVSWLEKSGVLDQLKQNNTPYTVIIPTDEAVGKLPSQILNQLDSEPKNLASLLQYHVIPGEINLNSLKDGQVLKALDEKPIQYTKLNNNQSLLSGAPVVDEYKQGEMKYLAVDRVLYPPHGTIFDIISSSPILTNISQIIKTANLVSEFSDSAGPYTLFAPTDEAFVSLDQDELLKVTRDIKSSRDFLVKHTLRSVLFTSAIPMNDKKGMTVENIDNKPIILQRKPNYVTANGKPLAYADITATNGVIHVLSKPL
ncbi:uncharacterized protein LOC107364166 isoform X2 [Tetranychus urticae]|uniref:uncharacterized protein LOC107364166 isoform X2 n=1 Tax=Tetranychus urticae TaxID=32264 RepID=UPI00077C0DF6|nr:uncharacterized protein LOC107364166 isoform X2 [Tetranychus urticae]